MGVRQSETFSAIENREIKWTELATAIPSIRLGALRSVKIDEFA